MDLLFQRPLGITTEKAAKKEFRNVVLMLRGHRRKIGKNISKSRLIGGILTIEMSNRIAAFGVAVAVAEWLKRGRFCDQAKYAPTPFPVFLRHAALDTISA